MVTKHYCDRCGKSIETQKDEFDEVFEIASFGFEKSSQINQPELCKECIKGYTKIIVEANKKIADYIKNNS